MKMTRSPLCSFIVTLTLGACAHDGRQDPPTGALPMTTAASGTPGEMRVTAPASPMVIQTPCAPLDRDLASSRTVPQIEVGLLTFRPAAPSTAGWQSVPYAGYRCGSH